MSPTTRPSARMLPLGDSPMTTTKRAPGSLKLAGLPRFHPANFPGPSPAASVSSTASTPNQINFSLSPAPLSPRSLARSPGQQSRQMLDSQRHLFPHQQRDHLGRSRLPMPYPTAANGMFRLPRPKSPHLLPLGSPGPVTPLELETKDSYFFTPSSAPTTPGETDKTEYVSGFFRAEKTSEHPSAEEEAGESMSRPSSRRGDPTGHRSQLSR